MSISVADLLVTIQGDASGAVAALGQTDAAVVATTAKTDALAASNVSAESSLLRTGQAGITMGAGISLGAAAVAGLEVSLIQMGAAFDAQITKIQSFTGATGETFNSLRDQVLSVSRATGEGATQVASGLYLARSSGLDAAAAFDTLSRSAQLGQAAMASTKDVVDVTTSALRAYHLGATDVAHIQDVLAATTTAGKLQFSDLAATLGPVLSTAAGAGISLEQLGASIATMTQKGIDSQLAVTSVRQTILALEAPTAQTRKELDALGVTVDDVRASIRDKGYLQTLDDLVGKTGGNLDAIRQLVPNVRALSGVMADLGTTAGQAGHDYEAALSGIDNSTGKSAEVIRAYGAGSQAAIKEFVANAKADLIELGSFMDSLAGPALTLVNALHGGDQQSGDSGFSEFLGKIKDLSNEMIKAIPHFGPLIDNWERYREAQQRAAQATHVNTLELQANQSALDRHLEGQPAFDDALSRHLAGLQQFSGAVHLSTNELAALQAQLVGNFTSAISAVANAYGTMSGQLSIGADALNRLNTATAQSGKSAQDSAAFHQQFTNALADYSLTGDAATNHLNALAAGAASADQSVAAAAKSQRDLDEIVKILGPDAAAAAVAHQGLLDTLAKTPATGKDAADQIDAINKLLLGTVDDAAAAQKALNNFFSKPSAEEDQIKAKIDENKASIASFDASLGSSAEQRVAQLQQQYDAEVRQGAPIKQQADTLAELNHQLSALDPVRGKAITDGQKHADALDATNKQLSAQETALSSHRQSLASTAQSYDSNTSSIHTMDSEFKTAIDEIKNRTPSANDILKTTADRFADIATNAGHAQGAVSGYSGAMAGVHGVQGGTTGTPFVGDPGAAPLPNGAGILSPEQIAQGLAAAGMDPSLIATQVALLLAESQGNTGALGALLKNGDRAAGFGQLTSGFGGISDADRFGTSPEAVQAQFQAIVRGQRVQGFGAWDPYTYTGGGNPNVNYGEVYQGPGQGSYRQYLPQGQAAAAAVGGGAGGNFAGNAISSAFGGISSAVDNQNPLPALDAGTASNDRSAYKAQHQLDQLNEKIQPLAEQAAVAGSGAMSGASQADIDAYLTSFAKIQPALDAATAAEQKYNADLADSSTSTATLAADQLDLQKAYDAVTGTINAASKSSQQLTKDQGDLTHATAGIALAQDQLVAEQSGQVKASTKDMTQAHLDADRAIAASAQTTAENAAHAALAAHQQVVDDINNHETPARIARDRAIEDSAQKAATDTYNDWHTAQTNVEADSNALAAQVTANNAAIAASQQQLAQGGVAFASAQARDLGAIYGDAAKMVGGLGSAQGQAALAAEQTWNAAAAKVLGIEVQLTGDLSAEDRKRLEGDLKTAQGEAANAQAAASIQIAAFTDAANAQQALNQTTQQATTQAYTFAGQLGVAAASGTGALATGLTASAQSAVDAWQQATNSIIVIEQMLLLPNISAADKAMLQGQLVVAQQQQALAGQTANVQIAAAQKYEAASQSADKGIASAESSLFDLKRQLTQLNSANDAVSVAERQAGLGAVISAEIALEQQVIAIEEEIRNTKDENARAALQVQLDAINQRLAAEGEAARQIKITAEDAAKATSGGGSGAAAGNGGYSYGFGAFVPGPNGTSVGIDLLNGGVAARGTVSPEEYTVLQGLAGSSPGGLDRGGGSNVSIVVQLDGAVLATAVTKAQTKSVNMNVGFHA